MNSTTVSEARVSAFNTLIMMFTEPGRAFAAVEKRSMVWLPLLLTLFCTALVIFWYYQIVDFAWLQDRMTANLPDQAAREKVRQVMSKATMQWSSAGGALIGIPVMYSLMALYFLVVGKIMKLEFGFAKWFSFIAWASVPSLLMLPLGAMQIVMAQNGQLGFDQLNPVTLNQLFFHIEMGKPWASLLDSISVISLWSAVLTVVGFQVWSKASRATAIAVVAIPYGLIYGVWIVVNLMSKSA